MDLFTYLMAKKGHNTHRDLFSYLLGKNPGGSGTYTTFSGTSLNISNTLQAKIKNIALEGNLSQETTEGNTLTDTVDYNATVNGVSITSKPNGIIILDGTATANVNNGRTGLIANTYQIPIGTNYVHYEYISGSVVSGGIVVNLRGTGNTTANQNMITSSNYSTNRYVERIISKDSTVDRVQFLCSSGDSFDNLKFRVWWSKSSDDTYEPYTGGKPSPSPDYPQPIKVVTGEQNVEIKNSDSTLSQNYPLSLGNIELAKIGNYKDYIFKNVAGSPYYNADLDLNGWYKYKAINKIILDGSETWAKTFGNNLFNLQHFLDNHMFIVGYGLSNYYKYNSVQSGIDANISNGEFVLQASYGGNIFIKNTNFDNVEDFKNWLSTHNTEILYILSNPTYTKITDTTLITQLENLNNARSYKGTTIIECTSESADNEVIGFSGDIKVTSVGNSLNTSLLSNNLQNEEPLSLDNTNEEEIEEPIENEEVS